MALLGRALLILGLLVALYGIGASLYGAIGGRPAWVDSGRRSVYALAGLMVVACVDPRVRVPAQRTSRSTSSPQHSSTTTPTFYKLAAPWSSQEGSLLLWVMLLSLWSSLVLFLTRQRVREIAPYATAVLLGFGGVLHVAGDLLREPVRDHAPRPPSEGAGSRSRCCCTRA